MSIRTECDKRDRALIKGYIPKRVVEHRCAVERLRQIGGAIGRNAGRMRDGASHVRARPDRNDIGNCRRRHGIHIASGLAEWSASLLVRNRPPSGLPFDRIAAIQCERVYRNF